MKLCILLIFVFLSVSLHAQYKKGEFELDTLMKKELVKFIDKYDKDYGAKEFPFILLSSYGNKPEHTIYAEIVNMEVFFDNFPFNRHNIFIDAGKLKGRRVILKVRSFLNAAIDHEKNVAKFLKKFDKSLAKEVMNMRNLSYREAFMKYEGMRNIPMFPVMKLVFNMEWSVRKIKSLNYFDGQINFFRTEIICPGRDD